MSSWYQYYWGSAAEAPNEKETRGFQGESHVSNEVETLKDSEADNGHKQVISGRSSSSEGQITEEKSTADRPIFQSSPDRFVVRNSEITRVSNLSKMMAPAETQENQSFKSGLY